MDLVELEQGVRNLNDRVGRIEQILPTLATKEDLAAAIAPLATKAELAAAIAPLATKEDLKAYATREDLRAEGELTRQHFNAVAERLETKIQVIAEGQVGLQESFATLRKDVNGKITQLDRRVTRLEASQGSRPPRTKPQ